jgi:hypothetical protein
MEGSRALSWRKSSRSGNNGGQCVEVAAAGRVLVRDSKDPDGARLAFAPTAWRAFAAGIKDDTDVVSRTARNTMTGLSVPAGAVHTQRPCLS